LSTTEKQKAQSSSLWSARDHCQREKITEEASPILELRKKRGSLRCTGGIQTPFSGLNPLRYKGAGVVDRFVLFSVTEQQQVQVGRAKSCGMFFSKAMRVL
jgi:hypothetical protein